MFYNCDMEITIAQESDVDKILTLQAQIYRVDRSSPNAQGYLKKQLKDDSSTVLIAKDQDNVIATANIHYVKVAHHARPYALLEGLVVDKSQRGQGVGTALFKKCIEVARAKKCYKMIFTSGKDRTGAHKFYKNLGFKHWGLEFRKDL